MNYLKFITLIYFFLSINLFAQAASDIVKKSTSGICHDKNSQYYAKTKNFKPYKTMKECLNSGGRLPKKQLLNLMWIKL